MAVYHVSATGSQTAPYDTEAKAIHNTKLLKATGLLADGDTVIIDSDITEPDGATAWTKPVIIKSTKYVRPVVTCTDLGFTTITPAVANATSGTYIFDNLHIDAISFIGTAAGKYFKLSILNCYVETPASFCAPLADGFEMINCVYKKTGSNTAHGMAPGMVFLGETTSVLIKNNVFISAFETGDVLTGTWIFALMPKSGSSVEVRDNIFYNPGTAIATATIFEPSASAGNIFEGNVKSGFGEWISGSSGIVPSDTNIIKAGNPGFDNSSGNYNLWTDFEIQHTANSWRNMGTLFQSGIGLVKLTGMEFFLGASGSDIFPYDTAEKAAIQPITLKNSVRNGDIINVVAGDEIVVAEGPDGQPWFHNVIIQSWVGNGKTRPVVRCTASFGLLFFMDQHTDGKISSKVSGLTIKSISDKYAPYMVQCNSTSSPINGLEISDMIYDLAGASGFQYGIILNSAVEVTGDGFKFHDNLAMYPPDMIHEAIPVDLHNSFGSGIVQIKNNTFVFGKIANNVLSFVFRASPNNTQACDIQKNIFTSTGPIGAAPKPNSLYAALSSTTINAPGAYDNIAYNIFVRNYPSGVPTIGDGAVFWENTKTDDPCFRNAAAKDYATPYGPERDWGWQGWLNDVIPAEPSRIKYKAHENKSVCEIVSGMTASMRTYAEIEGITDGMAPGVFARRLASDRVRQITSLDDTRNSVLILAMANGNSGRAPEPKATVCGTAGVIVAIPASNISGLSMTVLEEVVVIYSGDEAGMITTVDKAAAGTYYVVGRCIKQVVAHSGDVYHVELSNAYKVTK